MRKLDEWIAPTLTDVRQRRQERLRIAHLCDGEEKGSVSPTSEVRLFIVRIRICIERMWCSTMSKRNLQWRLSCRKHIAGLEPTGEDGKAAFVRFSWTMLRGVGGSTLHIFFVDRPLRVGEVFSDEEVIVITS